MRALPDAVATAPFVGSVALAQGLLAPADLRGPFFTRLHRDVYVSAGVELTVLVRARAALLTAPATSCVCGLAAAALLGADVLRDDQPIELAIPGPYRRRHRPGVVYRRIAVPRKDLWRVAGVTTTSPIRTAFDIACRHDLAAAVVAFDALGRVRGVTQEQLREYAAAHSSSYGASRIEQVALLGDPKAESPQESRLRLVLVLGGLPRPESQVVVCDRQGRFVARVDLAYPALKVVLEYDGAHHAAQLAADHARDKALAALGWIVLRFTAADLRDPARIVAEVAAVLASRAAA